MDNETKPDLIVIIQKLLADKTVLVIGSAVMAFTKVCPERVNLIHQVYRKLCTLLVDVDEWGQVIIVNTLTRYCRTQFSDPNLHVSISLGRFKIILKPFFRIKENPIGIFTIQVRIVLINYRHPP